MKKFAIETNLVDRLRGEAHPHHDDDGKQRGALWTDQQYEHITAQRGWLGGKIGIVNVTLETWYEIG